jgi:hypothetical protein
MKGLLLTIFLFVPSPLWAVDDPFNGLINIFGISGGLSCGAYLKDISTSPAKKNAYEWWVAGLVTGTNLTKGRTVSTDIAGITAWLKRYCDEHPLEPFMKAVIELDKELDKQP